MCRLIVQSLATGRFLAPGPDGQPEWFVSLRDAAGGVCDDVERVDQLIADWTELEDKPTVVDLEVIGTDQDTEGV